MSIDCVAESGQKRDLNGQDARWPHSQDGCATTSLELASPFELARKGALAIPRKN